jgi:transposase
MHQEDEFKSLLLIKDKFDSISYYLNEKALRIWCATEAKNYNKIFGSGGVTAVHRATDVSRPTIYAGLNDLKSRKKKNKSTIRKPGGGRKKITSIHPSLLEGLENLVEPLSRGDPMSPLRWTTKSVRNLAEELNEKGYSISFRTICDLLCELEYSLQSNRKTKEGKDHPDRNKQFEYINTLVKKFQKKYFPVISVDTKKKENIGEFKNSGKEYCPKGTPIKVNKYDFPNKELGKVAPYGIYDLTKNKGWVTVGISSDTAEFAVNSIRSWWYKMGRPIYKKTNRILITADCGGSNGYKNRLWKWELQKLADELKMEISICHFPPGTSKWNKIEHKMFSFITMNWRGRPLVNLETVINLIGNTKTKKGLTIKVITDKKQYEKGIKISDEDFNLINIKKSKFHGEWNYIIRPRKN